MMNQLKQIYLKIKAHRLVTAVAAALVVMLMCMSLMMAQADKVTITVDGTVQAELSMRTFDEQGALAKAGIVPVAQDDVQTTRTGDMYQITVTRAQSVSVKADGKEHICLTTARTVAAVLLELDITISADDIVSPAADGVLDESNVITISRVQYENVVETQSIAYETKKVKTDTLYKGDTKVTTKGANGQKELTYRVKTVDGVQTEKVLVSTAVTSEAVTKVVQVGTKAAEAKAAQTATAPQSYKKMISMTATAYTYGDDGGNITATGAKTRRGLVAVDPSVIPLGTRLYIETADGGYIYGEAVAADTGGAIKGNKIDLFLETNGEVTKFGRRTVNVYVL